MTNETSNEQKSVWLLVSANGSTTPSTYQSAADAKRWVFGAQTPVEFVSKATLDAVVSAAVAAERKRWATDAKTRVVFLHANGAMGLNDVLSAIGATEGGAP